MESLNQDFFGKMFNSHQAVMLLIDPETGSILDANAAATKFYKYSKKELKNLNIQDINILPPEKIKAEIKKTEKEEKNYFIFPHKLADNQLRWVEVYSSSIKFNNVSILLSIIHDITDRRKAENELRKSEEKFSAVFESNPNGIILSNLEDSKIIEVNEAFCKISGYKKSDVIGKKALELGFYLNPADREKMTKALKEKGSLRNFEMVVRHRSGKERSVLFSSELIETETGKKIITTVQDITKREKLEKRLRKKHDLFQAVFNKVPAMISIYDPEVQQVELNKEFKRVTGWQQKDIEQSNIMELVYPDPAYRKIVLKFMQSLEPGYKELIMTGKDGASIETIWANVALPDGRQVGIGIDIRERKKAEEKLHESHKKMDAALASMTDAVFISDLDGRYIHFNDAFATFHRFKNKDECAKKLVKYPDILELYLPDGKLLPQEQWAVPRALRGETVTNAEYSIHRKDTGEWWTGSYSFGPIRDKNEKIKGSVVVARDVTDLKNAAAERERLIKQLDLEKKALAESEQRYRIMGEAIDYGVWETDNKGRATYVSESFCRMTGKSLAEIKKFDWLDTVVPEQKKEIQELWMHSVRTGEPFEHEHHIISKEGDIRIVLARGMPVKNVEGKITSWAGINLDITDRKKIQEQLSFQNNHLKKINEVLEDFIQIAAHDLRSPIANLISINELISKQPDVENKAALFGLLVPITNRLQRTVEGLLETVTLQTEEKLVVKKIRFGKVWNEIKEELEKEMKEYRGLIHNDFENAPQINYVEVHLMSILRNLVSNALKYSAHAENPFIHISTTPKDEYMLLKVQDNGIGISLKKAGENLFKPFRRFTNKAEGNGIGLYIIKSIIEKNGGYVTVESQLNKGTTFYCHLKEYELENGEKVI